MKNNITSFVAALPIFFLLLTDCKNTPLSPMENELPINKTFENLIVSVLTFTGTYNGFPTIGTPPYPSTDVTTTLRFRNLSQSAMFDTLMIKEVRLYLGNSQQLLPPFQFDIICRMNGADWSAKLLGGQEDTVWCTHRFSMSQPPCRDSVYLDVKIFNRFGDSVTVRTPTVGFVCAY